MKYRTVYITTSNKEEAQRIGKELVAARLVACVNIFDGINSFYWWEGEIQEDHETVIIAKTKQPLMEELIEKVNELHAYDVPCIVSWPIREAHQDYIDWIDKETK
ncbi:MAG: divalent-cation tolerance protein CutA [Deltaproteobacteria bacterium]|nr:divalent-cation tolerance protein CutA [Deltaproteobacteria bacterium]